MVAVGTRAVYFIKPNRSIQYQIGKKGLTYIFRYMYQLSNQPLDAFKALLLITCTL